MVIAPFNFANTLRILKKSMSALKALISPGL